MSQPCRVPSGGLVDRARALHFNYDGVAYQGYAGDTLASALLANGVHLVGRSFKYHRPRGILSAGAEEPNALVQLSIGARTEPNARSTQVALFDGLRASSQNCWPSVKFDVGAINNSLSFLFPAGFYYKTFMWPRGPAWWLRYEHLIRRAAGMGRTATLPDPDHYEHRFAHCDVLVVGAGPAGLAAARAAAGSGARTIVCTEDSRMGGSLLGGDELIDGVPADTWITRTVAELRANPHVTLLDCTTAFGVYDDNLIGLAERAGDRPDALVAHQPSQRLWKVRAKSMVLASGAHERPIAFANNDLPGTMLAGAVQTYVQRFAVRPGTNAVVFTNNDSAYGCALALLQAGVAVQVVDARAEPELTGGLVDRARAAGLTINAGSVVTLAHGRNHVRAVDIAVVGGGRRRVPCDLVCMSGGWNPAVHLFSQARGKLRFDADLAAFVPEPAVAMIFPAGAARGCFALDSVLADGHAQGLAASRRSGLKGDTNAKAPVARAVAAGPLRPLWEVAASNPRAKRFVDFQNDVTVNDVALAAREGYHSVEHTKRYTTLGMGTDQGKTSNVVGLALLAQQLGKEIPAVGTTTFRAPYTPVTMGVFPGHATGLNIEPVRQTAMHDWHVQHGARMVNGGLWRRPHSYPRAGESEFEAANREALNVRTHVGVVDVSTLGKIELQGRDVAEFLNRIYCNRWDTLAVGRCRYGLMLREDGIVLDDGTTSRLAERHYLMTTTTVNAVKVMQNIELLLQNDWPELEVFATSVTEQWAAAAVSGPNARALLSTLLDIDLGNAAFPFLAVAECRLRVAGGTIPARLFRMSYSGESAYEVHVPAGDGLAMWKAIISAGEPLGIMPYGTEAMSTLRIEKGHVVVGAEADGRTTADDLGMGKLVTAAKWCIGKPLLNRADLVRPDRWQLVGLTALDGSEMPRAAKLVENRDGTLPHPMIGHVTAWCWSPNLNAWLALALLAAGRQRHGQTLWAVSPLANAKVRVKVGPPCFIDPDGERLRV
jgi:sarcosine oxidase, subunit alpha